MRLIQLLLQTDNATIIEKVKSIFHSEIETDIWSELNSDQQDEIQTALDEVRMGKLTDYNSYIANHKNG